MPFIRQFSVNIEKHPTTIETIDNWKKRGINISDKICQLIDAEATKGQGVQQ
ncbi:MAG TPA: hypothetical protein VKA40_10390 [Nitrososphaera sp.]|nr:hypothetical protein [Nitrososphaera sp.]